jgi:hypothetical protein
LRPREHRTRLAASHGVPVSRRAAALATALAVTLVVSFERPVEGAQAGAAIVDALAATVGTRVIMLSDVRLARELGIVEPGASDAEALDVLVDRALMLAEIERFQPPVPADALVERRTAEIRDGRGDVAWQALLERHGVDSEYVRALVRDTLRLEAYLRQRFDALAEPSEDEVRDEYETRRQAAPAGTLAPFDVVQSAIREQLRAVRYRALVDGWTAELRARGDVSFRGLTGASTRGTGQDRRRTPRRAGAHV